MARGKNNWAPEIFAGCAGMAAGAVIIVLVAKLSAPRPVEITCVCVAEPTEAACAPLTTGKE